MKQKTDTELLAIVNNALDQSLTISSELESDQGDAMEYYMGEDYGNEQEGRSQVKSRDVLETIEWIIPSLMRVFASGNKVVQFDPNGAQDEDQAEQETKIVNHVFMKENNGFEIIHNWFKDALLQKIGYVKIYWTEEDEVLTERYTGLSDFGMGMLIAEIGEDGEPVEHTENNEVQTDEMGNQYVTTTHDLKIKFVDRVGKLVIENVPQEEMRVSKKADSISLDDLDFVAHVVDKTASDLIEMGVDPKLVDQLGHEDGEGELENSREQYDEDSYDGNDESMRLITLNECYIRTDADGDNIAELRRIVTSGNHIIENEEWDMIPFAALTPILMPHKHIGLSEADLVMDIQLIKSTLMRQMLDNLYLTNNPEKEVVVSNLLNPDDVFVSMAGHNKRVKQAGTITPLTVPFTAGASMPIIEALDGMKEARTGVSRHTMGLDADTLAQSTKGAFQTGLKQANQRIEMLARVFAETGVKDLFLKIHALLIKHQDKAKQYKIDNDWVEINPSEWKTRKSMSVVVGVGTGDRSESMGHLMTVLEMQKEALQAGSSLADEQKIFNTLEKLIELADLKDVERYFNDPAKAPPKQPEPPSMEEQMMELQKEMLAMQKESDARKAQLEQQKLMLDIQLRKEQLKVQKDKNERDFVKSQQDMILDMAEQTRKTADTELKYQHNIPDMGLESL